MREWPGRVGTAALIVVLLLGWGVTAVAAQTAGPSGPVSPGSTARAQTDLREAPATPAGPVAAESKTPVFFDIEKIQPGLQGWGLTVISGTQPEKFPVEIVGLVKKASAGGGDLVMVKVGGAAIEKAGGIAAGMSGSPIYIGDQLVGALGYGFELADHTLGLVTPAGDMAKVLARVSASPQGKPEAPAPGKGTSGAGVDPSTSPTQPPAVQMPGRAAAADFDHVVIAPSLAVAQAWQQRCGERTGVFAPVSVPVTVTGLSGRALQRLREGLAKYPVEVVTGASGAGAGSGQPTPAQLKWPSPGQAFMVQLVRGDVDVSALGTITWVDGSRFVGFGHPFLNKGAVNFFTGPAEVIGSVPSVSMPFKVGYPLGAAGAVLQDRMAAVAGRVADVPASTLVDVRVTEDGEPKVRTQAEVVWDEELVGSLGSSVLLQAVDRALDRVGQGSATVTVTAKIAGIDTPVSRVNLFSSAVDISAAAVGEAAELLQLVAANPFAAAHLTHLNVKVDVRSQRNEAEILRVKAPSAKVHPGDRVQLEVTLLPYRRQPETRVLILQLPKDLPAGPLTVTVRGGDAYGGGVNENPDTSSNKGKSGGTTDGFSSWLGTEKPPSNLTELLSEFVGREHNNDLIGEFWVTPAAAAGGDGPRGGSDPSVTPVAENPGRPPQDGHKGDASADAWAGGMAAQQAVQAKLPTPYVIEGWIDVDLEVSEPETPSSAQPARPTTEAPRSEKASEPSAQR